MTLQCKCLAVCHDHARSESDGGSSSSGRRRSGGSDSHGGSDDGVGRPSLFEESMRERNMGALSGAGSMVRGAVRMRARTYLYGCVSE